MSTDYAKRVAKFLLVGVLLMIIALIIGSMIGYAIGGGNPWNVFHPSTWTHIVEFLK